MLAEIDNLFSKNLAPSLCRAPPELKHGGKKRPHSDMSETDVNSVLINDPLPKQRKTDNVDVTSGCRTDVSPQISTIRHNDNSRNPYLTR